MKILDKIKSLKYYVIRIDSGYPGGISANCSVFRVNGDSLDPENELGSGTLDEVLSQIPKYSAIILVFSGDQVLTRFSSDSGASLFEEIEADEFYLQRVQSSQGWVIQSACRKTIVDTTLDRLGLENSFILTMYMGPGSLIALENVVQECHVLSGHFQFSYKDGLLDGIREIAPVREEEDKNGGLDVSGTFMSSSMVLNLAPLLRYFNEAKPQEHFLIEQQKQYRFFHRCKKTAIGALGVFFILLLINFLLFSGVRKDLELLKSSGENQMAKVSQIEKLKTQIVEYRQLSNLHQSAPQNTFSFFLEELAGNRPSGIWFNSLELYPALKKPEKNKAFEVDRSVIVLKGESRNPVSLNVFIGSLKKRIWIEDVELLHYENSHDKINDDFELRIRKKI